MENPPFPLVRGGSAVPPLSPASHRPDRPRREAVDKALVVHSPSPGNGEAHPPFLTAWRSWVTWSKTARFSFIWPVIFCTAWSTVVWSRPPNCSPMEG